MRKTYVNAETMPWSKDCLYRTTMLKTCPDDWRLVELAKEWMSLDDKAAALTDRYKERTTIFTKKMVSLHELGLTIAVDDVMANVVLEDDDMLEFASADSHRQVIPEDQERCPSDRHVASQ